MLLGQLIPLAKVAVFANSITFIITVFAEKISGHFVNCTICNFAYLLEKFSWLLSLFPSLGDPRYLFAVEVTLRQNMPEELFLNDDPDSLMIEETSTLGLPNISDITRFQIELENSSSGKLENN